MNPSDRIFIIGIILALCVMVFMARNQDETVGGLLLVLAQAGIWSTCYLAMTAEGTRHHV